MGSAAFALPASVAARSSRARWFITGWLIAATCDICYATGFSYYRSHTPPTRILKYVASGLIGPSALTGGAGTAALGLALHYFNAFLFTAFFFAVASRATALLRHPILAGGIYGLGVYAMMNYVVVPLSRIGPRPTPPTPVWTTGVLVHFFLIGMPIALAARRALLSEAST